MKKNLSLVLCAALLLCMYPGTAYAAGSGSCGSNLTWRIEGDTLTIGGSGSMDNTPYDAFGYQSYGWASQASEITQLVLQDGVTSIGGFAFEGMEELDGDVVIPEGVTSISSGAFQYSNVESITLPASLTRIDSGAFFECPLDDVFYAGSQAQWQSIQIDWNGNDSLSEADIHISNPAAVQPSTSQQPTMPTPTTAITQPPVTSSQPAVSTPSSGSSGNIRVILDGDELHFDVPPTAMNNRTLVPLRAIFEAIGANVEWTQETQMISSIKDNIYVCLQLGNPNMIIENGSHRRTVTLDVPPIAINERTLVPARAVAEAYGCTVDWDGSTSTVSICSNEVLKGTTTYYSSAYISNGVVYYSLAMQPTIYAYDGKTTVSFAAGGSPLNIIVVGNTIYYLNYTNNTVCAIDRSTGKREILFNKLANLNSFVLYNGQMYINGTDVDDHNALYSLDLDTGISEKVYTADTAENIFLSSDSLTAYGPNALCIFTFRDTDINMMNAEIEFTAVMVDVETGKTQEILSEHGQSYNAGWSTSVTQYTNCPCSAEKFERGDNLFFSVEWRNTEEDGEVTTWYDYYQTSFSKKTLSKISESTFQQMQQEYYQSLPRTLDQEWTFERTDGGIFRVSRDGSVRELLVAGSDYRYITHSGDTVVIWQGERRSNKALWDSPNNYASAKLYTMDPDGNHLTEIATYTGGDNANFTTSGSGSEVVDSTSLPPITCRVCGGSGHVVCPYCHGAGRATHATVGLGGGIDPLAKCPNCGGSGRKTCAGCKGIGTVGGS